MKIHDTEDIQEAIRLLKQSEEVSDPVAKIKNFEEGIGLLDCYLEETPNVVVEQSMRIQNLKMSYTRRLLAQLPNLMNIDILVWFDYFKVLAFKELPEVKANLEKNPELKENHKKFMKLWIADLIKLNEELR